MESIKIQKYPAYKDSGVEWQGDIPKHWKTRPLFSVVTLKSISNCGERELLSVYLDKGVIKFSDVNEKRTNVTSEDLSKYQSVDPGDFVLNNQQAWRGSVGVSKYRGIVSPAYLVLTLSSDFNSQFANYLLRDSSMVAYYIICSKGVGTIQRNLYWPQLRRININIPPLAEQTAIAEFLDCKIALIDKAISIKEKQIELLKERRQILIHRAVTRGINLNVKLKESGVEWIGEIPEHWEVKALKYCTKIFRGKFTHRPRNDERLYDGDYPFFQTGDVARAGKFLSEFRQTLNDFGLRVSTLFPKGTIVITIAANIGDISILDIDACFPDSIVGFEPMSFIERDFLYNSLLVMKEQFMSSTIKNTQMNLNVDRIGINSITIPPKQEQIPILEYIETSTTKISTALSLKEQEIEKLKEYKASLINEVVTGKIKV